MHMPLPPLRRRQQPRMTGTLKPRACVQHLCSPPCCSGPHATLAAPASNPTMASMRGSPKSLLLTSGSRTPHMHPPENCSGPCSSWRHAATTTVTSSEDAQARRFRRATTYPAIGSSRWTRRHVDLCPVLHADAALSLGHGLLHLPSCPVSTAVPRHHAPFARVLEPAGCRGHPPPEFDP